MLIWFCGSLMLVIFGILLSWRSSGGRGRGRGPRAPLRQVRSSRLSTSGAAGEHLRAARAGEGAPACGPGVRPFWWSLYSILVRAPVALGRRGAHAGLALRSAGSERQLNALCALPDGPRRPPRAPPLARQTRSSRRPGRVPEPPEAADPPFARRLRRGIPLWHERSGDPALRRGVHELDGTSLRAGARADRHGARRRAAPPAASDAALAMVGLPAEALLGRTAARGRAAARGGGARSRRPSARPSETGEERQIEMEMPTVEGLRWLHLRLVPRRARGGRRRRGWSCWRPTSRPASTPSCG